jgi:hypothetical protein
MAEIESEVLTDSQMRRAEAISIARYVWPGAGTNQQARLATWIITGKWVES